MNTVKLDGRSLTLEKIEKIVYDRWLVELDETALQKAEQAKKLLWKMVDSETPVYGTNRGVGLNKDRKVYTDAFEQYNKNLLRSHSLCVPPYCSEEEVRAIMLIRLNCALYGCSGLSVAVLIQYAEFLNKQIHPLVPKRSSVGESDLAVNAMIGMTMIGEGDVIYQGTKMNSLEAMKRAGLEPLVLGPKDGLGIASSNSQAVSMTALMLLKLKKLIKKSEEIFCIGMEGLNGQIQQLNPIVTEARGYEYQTECAKECLDILEGSYLFEPSKTRALQDPLSFRDYAFITGTVKESADLVEASLIKEMNHSDDNPCVLAEEGIVSVSCNFEPLDLTLKIEMLNIALNHMSKGCCHRILKLADPAFTGLTRFLSPDGGKTVIGYSTIQKTMTALDAENRSYANPSSLDFLALSGYIEDHASNSVLAVEKTFQIIDNLRYIMAIELMHAAQAVDLREEKKLGKISGKVFRKYRECVTFLERDRKLSEDIQKTYEFISQD